MSLKHTLLALLMLCSTAAVAEDDLKCETGPAHKTYGGTDWIVYSCSDEKTVIFVSAPESKAAPFYFTLLMIEKKYELHGEGSGNRTYTEAAYEELKKLSGIDILALLAETRAASKANSKAK